MQVSKQVAFDTRLSMRSHWLSKTSRDRCAALRPRTIAIPPLLALWALLPVQPPSSATAVEAACVAQWSVCP